MSNITLSFILCFLAGLSTLIGALFIFLKIDVNKLTKNSLAFASGVMISVSLFDLIPEGLSLLATNSKQITFLYLIISITIGIILSVIMDKIIPCNPNVNDTKIYRVGVFSMIAIIFHNLPEGIITFLSSTTNLSLGITLTIAIALHNIPEGISISVPVYSGTKSKSKAILYTLVSGLAEPLGAFLAFLVLSPIINNMMMGSLLGIIAGIMLYIGMFELLPTSLKYKQKESTITFFIIGFMVMIISHILMG